MTELVPDISCDWLSRGLVAVYLETFTSTPNPSLAWPGVISRANALQASSRQAYALSSALSAISPIAVTAAVGGQVGADDPAVAAESLGPEGVSSGSVGISV